MSGLNEVNLIGNVGQQPQVVNTANGSTILKMSLATSDKWKDKQSGETKEKTEWHRISVFGKTAENLAQYINSGDKLFVRGKIQTSKYQDKSSGEDRYSTDIIVDGFSGAIQMLHSNRSSVLHSNVRLNSNVLHSNSSSHPLMTALMMTFLFELHLTLTAT